MELPGHGRSQMEFGNGGKARESFRAGRLGYAGWGDNEAGQPQWAAGRDGRPRGDLFFVGEGHFAELPAATDAGAVLGNFARGVLCHFLKDFLFADTAFRVE